MKKREKLALVHRYYPNAITTIDSVNKLVDYVEGELDLEPSQIMVADSICSDDVNSIQYPSRMAEFLGPFKMGGLDGFPFTGLTGMGAFAAHVPDEGALFIYYGPHIGVSNDGSVGRICRFGQSSFSGCCGAARAGLAKLEAGEIAAGNTNELDYQMNHLEQILLGQKERVLSAEHPIVEATQVIYEAIDQRIQMLVERTVYKCKYILLNGSILINGDVGVGSFTSTQRFDMIEVATKTRHNLLNVMLS